MKQRTLILSFYVYNFPPFILSLHLFKLISNLIKQVIQHSPSLALIDFCPPMLARENLFKNSYYAPIGLISTSPAPIFIALTNHFLQLYNTTHNFSSDLKTSRITSTATNGSVHKTITLVPAILLLEIPRFWNHFFWCISEIIVKLCQNIG